MGRDRYEISGVPVPWKAHKGNGRKSFSPRIKEKTDAQWQLKIQHNQRPLHERAVRVDFFFEMPIPSNMPRNVRDKIANGEKVWHDKRPDRSNLEKLYADCLVGTVLLDDNIIVCGEVQKYYAKEKPRTIIYVNELGE